MLFLEKLIQNSTYVYPASMFMRQVFPEPEGPIMADNSPPEKSPLTWSKSFRDSETKITKKFSLKLIINF